MLIRNIVLVMYRKVLMAEAKSTFGSNALLACGNWHLTVCEFVWPRLTQTHERSKSCPSLSNSVQASRGFPCQKWSRCRRYLWEMCNSATLINNVTCSSINWLTKSTHFLRRAEVSLTFPQVPEPEKFFVAVRSSKPHLSESLTITPLSGHVQDHA